MNNNLSDAFEQFISTGDFLSITCQVEKSINYPCTFELPNAKLSLFAAGVLMVEPKNENSSTKDIVISSGIHGNETAPIEIVNLLVSEIIQGKTQVKNRTLFIIANPVAVSTSKRFEIENLNRLFCGKHKSITPCYERSLAEKLERYVSEFFTTSSGKNVERYHYDLHTAIRASEYEKFAIYPYLENKNWQKEQLVFLQCSGIKTILLGHAPSGTFSYFTSSTFQAHAFTVELGKVMPFGQNNIANFAAITDNLRKMVKGESIELPLFDNADFNLFEVLGDITKSSDDFVLHVADDVSNFTEFPIGTLLSQDGDKEYITTKAGERIVFPNANVANGQRAGLLVVPTRL